MINIDRELTPKRVTSVTLAGLRCIRNYFIEDEIMLDDNPVAPQWQKPLKDAELLGTICAVYSIDPRNRIDVSKQENQWLEKIDKISEKYIWSHWSHALRSRLADPTDPVMDTFLNLIQRIAKKDVETADLKFVEQIFLRQNYARFSLPDLYDNQLLVLSPLSTDYLIACLLQRIIWHLSPTCFRLKPIILSHKQKWDYRPLAIPDPEDKHLADINRVEVFIESNSSGETERVATQAARIFCRTKVPTAVNSLDT